ncbi:MAG: DPP IV N-terminal domain-containing protein, partial [Rikenellaceae bacterium]
MKKRFLTFLLCSMAISSYGSPLWLRYSAILPDGQQIAFKYKGDLYTVPTSGGTATQLTSSVDHESFPVWSHDSRTIAFASDKEGGFDVYTIPAQGGQPTRLTTHSAAETPLAFSADNSQVYFSATIEDPASSALNPAAWLAELYKVSTKSGARPQLVVAAPISSISFDKDGESF